MEHILPEDVEHWSRDKKAANTHPQSVRECSKRKSYDEDRKDRGDEHDERLGGEKVEEEPHYPSKEGAAIIVKT